MGAEISDNLYKRHIQMLQSENSDKVYRHFTLNNRSIISVRESLSIISNGTTGLYIWQVTIGASLLMFHTHKQVRVLFL